ncbi:hypothetical protein BDR26DRAFT_804047 [Obelidium mucronatum]|nr:hypothetical protein BDR26DRAFT_804047 [Obelidium mucronatum]
MDKQEKKSHDSTDWDWWWSHVLKLYLKDGVRDPGYAIRAVSLQVLAHFPASIFQELELDLQDFVKRDVVGVLAGDADEDVKSNCCLTVGLWVTLDYFIKDAEFIETLSRQLPTLTFDKGLLVRVRSSWAVANLADTLLALQQNQENRNILPTELLQPLIRSAIHSANDNEKCRSNGVRAVGNLLRLSPPQLYACCFSPTLAPEIDAITKNISSGAFKVRWNACYAAYNLLQSPILQHILQNGVQLTSLAPLFDALITALAKSKNFKVRINAAMALAGPPTLAIYCGKHDEILVCLRKVGETVDDDLEETKFGEFKYRKGLEEQVAKTLGYLERLLV